MQEIKEKPKLAIITPAYNPTEAEIRHYVASVNQIIADLEQHYILSFVVVDDGSTQKIIIEEIAPAHVTLITLSQNQGKGEAIKIGLKSIQNTDIVVYTDFDFPYILENLYEMVALLIARNADIVLAKRSKEYFTNLPFQRKLISKILLFINRNVMDLDHFDTQAGLKVLKAKHSQMVISTRSAGFLFEIEFIYAAQKEALKMVDYVVTLRSDVQIPTISLKTIFKNIRAMFDIITNRIFS